MSSILEDVNWHKRIILVVVSILTAMILSPRLTTSVYRYIPGDIVRQNVKASRDMLVEDTSSTLKKREEALSSSLSVYDYDEKASSDIRGTIVDSFSSMRGYLAEIEANAVTDMGDRAADGASSNLHLKKELISAYREESRAERLSSFREKWAYTLEEADFRILEESGFGQDIVDILMAIVIPVMDSGVIDSKEQLSQEKGRGIIVRNVTTQKEHIMKDTSRYLDLVEARESVSQMVLSYNKGVSKRTLKALSTLTSALMRPNLTFNKNETEFRKAAAAEEVSPVFYRIKEGEMILREGERVTSEHIIKLNALVAENRNESNFSKLIGLIFMTAMILYVVYHFSVTNIRKISLGVPDMIFLGGLFVAVLFACRLSLPVAAALGSVFPYIPATSYQYIFTAAAGAMLVRIVLNSETAVLFAVVISLMAAIIMKDSLLFGIYTFIGCIVGAHTVRYCKTRVSLVMAGIYVGIVNVIVVLVFGMAYGQVISESMIFSMLLAFLGGVISGIIVTGTIPVVEGLFGYTTNFKLLELASLDHPLLKELITQAPGTYHHSWIIGNLVENAAEAINANPLFARVSALYHDIGKMKKPQYFFENQKGERNPHDKLAPSLSSLIIIGHVKDGIELAREHKLGKRLTDIIPQHHGTKLISYFYSKAKEKEDPDVHTVNEKDFRYPGPKPQTKEAGLVMLADAVEAASRTIQDPTPARIRQAVQKIIGNIFADGQLDECELTLKDLNKIAESFNRILNGIFHARIDYPEPVINEEKGKKIEGADRDKKENAGAKEERDRRGGKENTKAAALQ